jgi:hypothetical protein
VSLNDRGFKQLINILIMKNLSKLGKALNKAEQKEISGGLRGLAPYIDLCGTGDGAGRPCNLWYNQTCCPGLTCIDPRNSPWSQGICI